MYFVKKIINSVANKPFKNTKPLLFCIGSIIMSFLFIGDVPICFGGGVKITTSWFWMYLLKTDHKIDFIGKYNQTENISRIDLHVCILSGILFWVSASHF